MLINKGKETKRKLVKIQSSNDPETLSPATTASKVNNETKYKTELEQMKVAYQELKSRYETDISALKQKAEKCQQENEKRAKTDLQLINELRAEKNNHQKRAQNFESLHQKSTEMVKNLHGELEKVQVSFQELKNKYDTNVFALKRQKDTFEQQLDKGTEMRNSLRAEKDALQQQVNSLQQLNSECEGSYKRQLEYLTAELEDRDDLGPPKRKMARRQEARSAKDSIPAKTTSDPASMDLDDLSEEIQHTDVTQMELDEFVEEMLREADILDSESMEEEARS
ncbi:uveal autoantigen with coiled-coil domains and ankyrin repeats protein-like [Cyprinodon tularosa]|uniref:uveal autoantigen with coiled-coil domains and ankyrin repeats protein-like n=1 Tax=Cyprinodon tularosa TaxID=77115 RepID=UPI0018E28F50|nr:uveal autoantigen with coiled-coil domains and ankyrin repeats protein-like [Cyprinodon tularosa]